MAEKSKGQILDEMDEASVQAEEELKKLKPESVNEVATWWKSWFMKAGHKRLGRLLIKYVKHEDVS